MCGMRQDPSRHTKGKACQDAHHGKDEEEAEPALWRHLVQQLHEGRDAQEGEAVTMMDIGRHCVKFAGRDAGKHCLIIDVIDSNHVMIDGETRRRKCNVRHLEPLDKVVDLRKNASHENVIKALQDLGVKVREIKPVRRRPKKTPEEKKPAKKKK